MSITLSDAEHRLALQLLVASRILGHWQLDDLGQGQISARIRNRDRFLIKRSLCGFFEAQAEDMIVCPVNSDLDAPLDPMLPPEYHLHQAIYSVRDDICSIVHSHGVHVTAFSATDAALDAISHAFSCSSYHASGNNTLNSSCIT